MVEDFSKLFENDEDGEKNKKPVFKFSKRVKNEEGGWEEREFVSVGGIELEVNTVGRGTQFTAEEFANYSLDSKSMKILMAYAKAIKLGDQPLIEGATAIGKSKALEYLAYMTNNFLIYQSFSQDTDVSELIGKYVPNTEDARKSFERLLSAHARQKYGIKLREETQDILEAANRRVTEESWRGLTEDECKRIAELEGLRFGDVQWAWQDGTVPRAMEHSEGHGCWLYFDEMGAAPGGILVKMNRVINQEKVKRIEITEDGGREVVGGTNFHLFASTNSPTSAGREPFAPDYLRRWIYQRMGKLSAEQIKDRAKFKSHGKKPAVVLMTADEISANKKLPSADQVPASKIVKKVEMASRVYDLNKLPEVSDLLIDVTVDAVFKVIEYLANVTFSSGEQPFEIDDPTDIDRLMQYWRVMQGLDLVQTVRDSFEYIYANKVDAQQLDDNGANVRKKIMEVLELVIVNTELPKKLEEELAKVKTSEQEEIIEEVEGLLGGLHGRLSGLREEAED